VVGVAPDPVFRVVPDARPSPRLADLGLVGDRPLVVYVGGFGPHKNVGALLSAFADLPPRAGDARLVLVGDPAETFHSAYPALVAEVARRGLGARACFTGFLPDPDLAILLNLARVLVLPSLLEGLGLPAVEAAACGCPVIATARSPLPALLGGGGLYVDPERPAEIGEALVLVLGSAERRQAMRQAGLAAAAALTWDGAARQLMAALDAALRLP
jgi:glycosyltransferase involved in cell wall biosynthesis